tara:strand:- start:366 stop:1556 length:1191 start_codon:yes stop_codon:yes gene_type:complete
MAISRGLQPRQMYQDGSIMPRLNELGSSVSSAEQMLQEINQRLQSAESTLGEGGGMQQPASLASDVFTSAGVTGGPQVSNLSQPLFDKDGFRLGDQRYGTGLVGGPSMALPGSGLTNQTPGGPMQSPLAGAMRNMAANGGMMNRQQYGLGSLVKSVTKGIKGAVKGVAKAAKSPLGLAAIASFVPFGGQTLLQRGMGFLGSKSLPSFTGVKDFFKGDATLGKTAAMFAGGSLLGGLASAAESGDEEAVAATRDVNALRSYLEKGYRNLNYSEDEIPALVESDVAEYSAGQGGYANGGRIGYALGTPEQNAIEAAGIMNLPLNQNPAGVTELDLRETGGFIPPVGVKEKADDIPAMLANNEFVFTADAVRGMGDGNVNKGAQRMYDMMKKLEKGGRV